MTQIRCTAFPTHSNHPLSRPSRYASLANELEGYKYTIKYDDGDAEEFSEKGGGKYIKTIQQFKNAIIVAYVSNDGNNVSFLLQPFLELLVKTFRSFWPGSSD